MTRESEDSGKPGSRLRCALLVRAPDPAPAPPGLGVSPEVAATQAARRESKPASSRVRAGADSWEAAGAGAPQRCPHLPRRAAGPESSPSAGTASASLRKKPVAPSTFHPFQAWLGPSGHSKTEVE